MARERYADALGLTRGKGAGDQQLQNVRGVCLLRTGQVDEALMLFRGMALQTGGISVRKDCSPLIAINFATSLLLSAHPAGCLEVLRELPESLAPVEADAVVRLDRAIRDWERRLSWWGWLDWKVNRIASTHVPVRLEGLPGLTGWEAESAGAPPAMAAATR
jgi:hypothetical protein